MSLEQPSLAELEAGPLDPADDEILRQIAALYTTLDPPPAGLVERIQFGITLDALHAEIAELERTSALLGVRSSGASDAQSITFTAASLTLMITISVIGSDRVRIDGWVAPGGGVAVDLRGRDGVLTAEADTDGRFVFAEVERGLAQFVVRPPEPAAPVMTPSIEI